MTLKLQRIGLIVSPFLIWCFFFRDFLNGNISVNGDTFTHYVSFQYFFRHLFEGIIPLWEPYIYGGRLFLELFIAGFYNPLIFLAAIFWKLGFSLYQSYLLFYAFYFWLGACGFALICRRIFDSPLSGFVGYVFILFSGVGMWIFTQVYTLILFVPAVWFFVFFLEFIHNKRKPAFLGLVFCTMLIMTSYYPFYFLTLGLVLLTTALALFYPKVKDIIKVFASFIRHNPGHVLFACLAILIAVLPLITYKINASTGDMVYPTRHLAELTKELGKGDAVKSINPTLNYDETTRSGTLGERLIPRHIFSHSEKFVYSSDDNLFIPVWVYIIIGASAFVFMDKRKVFILASFFVLFLISLGDAAPIHRFFYDRIFFFKYFRNFFFFSAYLLPLFILFSVGQFKSLIEYRFGDQKEKRIWMLLNVLVHVVLLLFFDRLGDVPLTSFITLAFSYVFFSLVWKDGGFSPNKLLPWMILFIALIQPAQVFQTYRKYAEGYRCNLEDYGELMRFSLSRPENDTLEKCFMSNERPRYDETRYLLSLTDSPGAINGDPAQVGRWIFQLYKTLPHETYFPYMRHKFIFYSQTKFFEEVSGDTNMIGTMWDAKANMALIARYDQRLQDALSSIHPEETFSSVDQEDESFRITRFSPNKVSLETNLTQPQFLVYNDTFHAFWRAYIDGKEVILHRANLAFKGVGVPQGRHKVEFRFEPPIGGWGYFLVLFFNTGVLALCIFSYFCDKGNESKMKLI